MRRLALILTACAALAVPAAARADGYADTVRATPGLADYWRLDEASGSVAADAVGGFDATWSGSPGLNATGALSFDDDAGVTLNGSSAAWAGAAGNFPGDFSVEAWIKPTSNGTRYAVSRGSTSRGYGLWLTSTWAVVFSSGSTNAVSAPVARGVWHHVVGTVAGPTVTLYVDGAVAATATLPGAPLTTSSPLYLGRYSSSCCRYW